MTAPAVTSEQVLLTVNAHAAATAWLNAFLATGQEADRSQLYRTMSLEFYPEGMQLIATDGTALFRTWVPRSDLEGDWAWPAREEVPTRKVVVMDLERFGVGFVKILHQLTSTEERSFESLTLSVAEMDEGATLALGEDFVSERLVLRACGQRMDLRIMQGHYPAWRDLQLGIDDRERVAELAIATRLFAMVGKLKGAPAVEFEFHGTERYVGFRASALPGALARVRGMLMPMRRAEPDRVAPEESAGEEPDPAPAKRNGKRPGTRRGHLSIDPD